MEAEETPKKRRPGRPVGSRNKPALHRPQSDTTDPMELVERNLSMIDLAQRTIRLQMQREIAKPYGEVSDAVSRRLLDVSNALVRTVDALKKANLAIDEIEKKLSPAQRVERAVRWIRAAGPAAVRNTIKVLHNEPDTAPVVSGADALAALGEDDE